MTQFCLFMPVKYIYIKSKKQKPFFVALLTAHKCIQPSEGLQVLYFGGLFYEDFERIGNYGIKRN